MQNMKMNVLDTTYSFNTEQFIWNQLRKAENGESRNENRNVYRFLHSFLIPRLIETCIGIIPV